MAGAIRRGRSERASTASFITHAWRSVVDAPALRAYTAGDSWPAPGPRSTLEFAKRFAPRAACAHAPRGGGPLGRARWEITLSLASRARGLLVCSGGSL